MCRVYTIAGFARRQKLSGGVYVDTKVMAYFALFHSVMTYSILWGNTTGATSIFRLQKRAVHALIQANSRGNCKKYFKDINIMALPCFFILECLV